MSSTHSSHPSSNDTARYAVVRKLVAERAGREWCLFLDRDGVINRQIVGDYVREWRDFEWLPQARRALKVLREWAPHLVVVTNQQGIGKGLMSADDVESVHHHVRVELATKAVSIDAIQVCPHLESAGCACRKPRTGLVIGWLEHHPDIDPSLSVMVGDSQSDLELAKRVAVEVGGCASVGIGERDIHGVVADASFDSLWDFAIAVERARHERG
jgi:histidinol-phosphate phosphatase family protein